MIVNYTTINPMTHQPSGGSLEMGEDSSEEDIEDEIERVEHTRYFEWWVE